MSEAGPEPAAIDLKDSKSRFVVRWEGDLETQIPYRDLRLACRCALCVNELSGKAILDPDTVPEDVGVKECHQVGNYGVQIEWTDGHRTGIYTWERIRELGEQVAPEASWKQRLGRLVPGAALSREGGDGRRAPIGAALCGLAVFHQGVLGPAALVVVLPALLSADVRRRARLVTGLVAGLSPFLLHLVLVGPRSMLDGMVIDPIFRDRKSVG